MEFRSQVIMFHSLTILVCFVTIFELCAAEDKQRTFIFEDKVKPGNDIITRDFGRHVEKILDEEQVHGVAIGIVRPDGEIELGAWGTSSEGGQPATADVREKLCFPTHHLSDNIFPLDIVCDWVVYKGIPYRIFWYPYR